MQLQRLRNAMAISYIINSLHLEEKQTSLRHAFPCDVSKSLQLERSTILSFMKPVLRLHLRSTCSFLTRPFTIFSTVFAPEPCP